MEEKLHEVLYEAQATLAVLFFKTWTYHWNIVGDNFYELHKLLNDQYDSIGESLDRFAEHMRYRRIKALGPLNLIMDKSAIKSANMSASQSDMLTSLVADNKQTIKTLQQVIDVAKELDYEDTVNICADIQESLGKNIWMLTAFKRG